MSAAVAPLSASPAAADRKVASAELDTIRSMDSITNVAPVIVFAGRTRYSSIERARTLPHFSRSTAHRSTLSSTVPRQSDFSDAANLRLWYLMSYSMMPYVAFEAAIRLPVSCKPVASVLDKSTKRMPLLGPHGTLLTNENTFVS